MRELFGMATKNQHQQQHEQSNLKTIGGVIAIALAVLTPIFTWSWSIQGRVTKLESQSDVTLRVKNLEDALMPLLVEYKVNQEIKRIMKVPTSRPAKPDMSRVTRDAESWAKQRFSNGNS